MIVPQPSRGIYVRNNATTRKVLVERVLWNFCEASEGRIKNKFSHIFEVEVEEHPFVKPSRKIELYYIGNTHLSTKLVF